LSEFVERRRLQVARGHARNLGWYEIESVLLEEGCKLTDQNLINLKTLTQGELKVERIQEALRTLDVTRNQNLKGASATNKMASMITTQPRPFSAIEFDPLKAGEDFMPSSNSQYPELVTLLETLDEMSVSSGDLERIYATIEEQDLGEQEGRGVFMSLVQEAKNKNGKTWAQNKQLKLQIRKNRGYTSHMDTKHRVENRVTLLKSKTRCFICKKRGHWKEECPERSKNSSKEPYKNSSKESYFLVSEATLVTESVMNAIVLLIVEPLHALMDTAAGQAIMSEETLVLVTEELAGRGLKTVPRNVTTPPSSGIGGSVQPVGVHLVPTSIGDATGVIEFIILPRRVPTILPSFFLDGMGAIIDYNTKMVQFRGQEPLPFDRHGGGHISIPIFGNRCKTPFPVSEQLKSVFPELLHTNFETRELKSNSGLNEVGRANASILSEYIAWVFFVIFWTQGTRMYRCVYNVMCVLLIVIVILGYCRVVVVGAGGGGESSNIRHMIIHIIRGFPAWNSSIIRGLMRSMR
jgi:hypothetical protein